MRILILGYKGFFGSFLLSYLKQKEYVCITVDSILDLKIELLESVDIFLNCAGASNVSSSFDNPKLDFENNTVLVFQILEQIRNSKNNNLKFINFSSAAVYGNPLKLPIVETDDLNPISPYGFNKKIAEDLCRMYYKCFGLKTLSLRVFSAYGVGQKKMLLWDLHQKILSNKGELILFGTGEESRDFIHILDIMEQIKLALEYADFTGETINIANGVEIRVREVVELYKMHHPSSFNFKFNGLNKIGDPLNWCADISKMKSWGYTQSVSIEDGIKSYLNWASKE